MFALWTLVTFFRLCLRAYSKAYLTIRSVPVTEIGLIEIPESGRIVLPLSFLMSAISSAVSGLPFSNSTAEVEVLGVLADDDEVDLGVLEVGPDAVVVLAGADARVEVEGLAEVDVDRAEAGADRSGDRRLEGDLGPPAGLDDGVGDGCPDLGHDVDARFLDVPVDRDAGCLDAKLRGLGQFGADAVAGDQGHVMGHGKRLSVSSRAIGGVDDDKMSSVIRCVNRTRSVILISAGTNNLTARRGVVKPRPFTEDARRPEPPIMIYPPQSPSPLVNNWVERHRDPRSFVLHLLGIPCTILGVLLAAHLHPSDVLLSLRDCSRLVPGRIRAPVPRPRAGRERTGRDQGPAALDGTPARVTASAIPDSGRPTRREAEPETNGREDLADGRPVETSRGMRSRRPFGMTPRRQSVLD